jgi:hypothetical protein
MNLEMKMYKTDATTNDIYTYAEFNEKSENLFESEKEHSGNVVNSEVIYGP